MGTNKIVFLNVLLLNVVGYFAVALQRHVEEVFELKSCGRQTMMMTTTIGLLRFFEAVASNVTFVEGVAATTTTSATNSVTRFWRNFATLAECQKSLAIY